MKYNKQYLMWSIFSVLLVVGQTRYVNIDNNDNNEYGNSDTIKLEIGWNDVEIRNNADLHLSLLSQGYYNGIPEQYDTSYYYPSSAGKDIDIIMINTGFNFRHPEFNNKEERITKILGVYNNGTIEKVPEDDYYPTPDDIVALYNYHGEIGADIIGGLKHGVASKANIFGIVTKTQTNPPDPHQVPILLKHISKNIPIKPHRTILNLTFGDYFPRNETELIKEFQDSIDIFNKLGVVVIAAAGNHGLSIYGPNNDLINLPCALDGVICVGSIDNFGINDVAAVDPVQVNNKADLMDPKYYRRAKYSNYGDKVDIYAPGLVRFSVYDANFNNVEFIDAGTSYSSPIVAGVAANIMSEFPEHKFDSYSMHDYLIKIGQKDIIDGIMEGPNIFINNGKRMLNYINGEEQTFNQNVSDIEVDINVFNDDSDSDFDSDSDVDEE
ncbi:hypothetical protein PIROE2DRAFT_14220 [Piromyces sp. E2]|nr:hypothetical protein PIROE2DRAFT_14220 [Piromyces sp. E2]|eukprot:OUM60094.1 hypothetical protein PIROE2DRAFT_14220 [Piromyces sp. E2]